MAADPLDLSALSLNVPMTKSLDRLLNRAAAARSQTPEVLAQRILREWLLAEGGFRQDAPARRETDRERTGLSASA